jgi:uncharacterized YigZ family protein
LKAYHTIKNNSEEIYIEKKSRFIGRCIKVSDEKTARDIINRIKKEHREASHNVYAYRLRDMGIQRFSDDGEPSGTAGKPVMDIILKKDLFDILIVITRYFGGIKLGSAGLFRAYGKAASGALLKAETVKMDYVVEVELDFDYNLAGIVDRYLDNNSIKIVDKEYTEKTLYKVYIEKKNLESFKKEIFEISNGNIIIKQGSCSFHMI